MTLHERRSCLKRLLLCLLIHLSTAVRLPCLTAAFSTSTNIEKDAVRAQLGYLPANFLEVSAWSCNGSPVAIKTYPLRGGAPRRQARAEISSLLGTPFPTLYWLSCPEISTAISDLERLGYIQLLEAKVNKSAQMARRLLDCHDRYAKERWACLTNHDKDQLLDDNPSIQRMRKILKCSGISGTNLENLKRKDGSFTASIKCLHAHYAHFRCQGHDEICNPVGQMVHEILSQEFPMVEL